MVFGMLEEGTDRKRFILNTVRDMILDFLHYDRKEDAQLPPGSIEEALRVGEITQNEIVEAFRDELRGSLPELEASCPTSEKKSETNEEE